MTTTKLPLVGWLTFFELNLNWIELNWIELNYPLSFNTDRMADSEPWWCWAGSSSCWGWPACPSCTGRRDRWSRRRRAASARAQRPRGRGSARTARWRVCAWSRTCWRCGAEQSGWRRRRWRRPRPPAGRPWSLHGQVSRTKDLMTMTGTSNRRTPRLR